MKKKYILLPLFFLLAFLLPTSASADGIIIPEPPICLECPGPIPISGALDIVYHDVDVIIDQQVAITRVDQVFRNPNDFTVEGTYIFPLPKDAAVTNFTLWIDGQPVQGEVLSADEARQRYEEIVRQMIDPALLEYVGQGAVQASIFPIEPGQERRIQLEYTQALPAENGLVRYSYPLNTEKFSRIPLERVTVSVSIATTTSIRAVYSPTHDVAVSRDSDFSARVGYEDANVKPDTDFILYYSLGETEAFHLLSFRDPGDRADPDGFYLMLLAPRPNSIDRVFPKDLLIVVDKSGSMDGEKWRQAQGAVRFILENLNSEDTFNIITFSTGVEMYGEGLLPASDARDAIAWIEADRPLGSTDINRALLEASSLIRSQRPTYVIFITDGLPTEGETNSARILDNLSNAAPVNLRLFTFGVGYDVDTFLLDSLAQAHAGASSYVTEGEQIDEIVSAFYQKVSTPVLTDLELEVEGVAVFDEYPTPLPDLFAGSQIIVVGRYDGGGSATVTLSGIVDGERQTFEFPQQYFRTGQELAPTTQNAAALPRLWATRKIGFLLNQVRLNGPNEETIEQIVRLSIRFGIVTPYTSYLVTEDMALGESSIENLAADDFAESMEAPRVFTGADAVTEAEEQSALSGADTAFAPPAEARDLVKIVGPRTFVFTGGVWTDTGFDPDSMDTVRVGFLSDDYFDLTQAYPELGQAFALGPQVIAFADGVVYEVVAEGQPVDDIQIDPDSRPPQSTDVPDETVLSDNPVGTPVVAENTDDPVINEDPVIEPSSNTRSPGVPCLSGLLPLMVFGPLLFARKRKK